MTKRADVVLFIHIYFTFNP